MNTALSEKLKTIRDAAAAGLMISLVSYCYIVCENKWFGAILFSFGLIIVCRYSLRLFTGMAGYLCKSTWMDFLIAAAVNCVCAWLVGFAASFHEGVREKAAAVCQIKFSVSPGWLFFSAVLCGIMIYLGVDYYKKHGNCLGILFAIPIFVISGFDHTVADLFYIGASGSLPENAAVVIFLLAAGNTAGSNLMRALLYRPKEQ